EDVEAVVARLRDDERIGVLVNNAGASLSGGFTRQEAGDIMTLVSLNASAVAALASAVAPRFIKAGQGAIINIGSVVGLA
ncbi:SDR family NAD(P)-dependent oxidoreductase, partial [Escherichia coli]|nr:SDR family NAD(P)-dependent oxidoreductase [Escherichia coli]